MGRYNNPFKTKKNNNKGATLMVAIIIIGILIVFAFSLLLVTYTLHASQNKNIASKMNSEAANTLSIALKTELGDTDAEINSDLWKYLRFNIGRQDIWPYYCPELGRGEKQGDLDAYKYFELKTNYVSEYFADMANAESAVNPDGFPGSVKLGIYWRLPKDVELEAIQNNNAPDSLTSNSMIRLYIDIICETASQTYVVTNEYELRIENMTDKDKKRLDSYSEVNSYNPDGRVTLTPSDKNEKWVWVPQE